MTPGPPRPACPIYSGIQPFIRVSGDAAIFFVARGHEPVRTKPPLPEGVFVQPGRSPIRAHGGGRAPAPRPACRSLPRLPCPAPDRSGARGDVGPGDVAPSGSRGAVPADRAAVSRTPEATKSRVPAESGKAGSRGWRPFNAGHPLGTSRLSSCSNTASRRFDPDEMDDFGRRSARARFGVSTTPGRGVERSAAPGRNGTHRRRSRWARARGAREGFHVPPANVRPAARAKWPGCGRNGNSPGEIPFRPAYPVAPTDDRDGLGRLAWPKAWPSSSTGPRPSGRTKYPAEAA